MEAKLYESMEEAVKSAVEQGYEGDLGVARYEDKYLIYGKSGKCKGCDEEGRIEFHEGMWLCPICIIKSIRETYPDETVSIRINTIREEDGIRIETLE